MDRADKPLRLGVLLSGGGRTLMNLLDRAQSGNLNIKVTTVIASRCCAGIERSRARGLDVHRIPYKEYRRPDGTADVKAYSAAIAERLDAADVELVAQAGFLSLWFIPPRYALRVMNIHPALLPSFGGAGMYGHHVHEAVLAAGCKVSGCTVHFATNEYDAGPIIVQRAVPVLEGDDADSLADRVFDAECKAYPDAIRLFAEDRLRVDGRVVHVL